MKHKLKEWLVRYLPGEVLSVGVGLSVAWLAHVSIGSPVAVAFLTTWAEMGAYYAFVAGREVRGYLRAHRGEHTSDSVIHIFWMSLRNILFEFLIAEMMDAFFVRPFFLYMMLQYIENFTLAIFLGMMCANAVFYVFVITGYEVRKRMAGE